MRISFLTHSACGGGGISRAVCNLANALADHLDVSVLSVFRTHEQPQYRYDERVRIAYLVESMREEPAGDVAEPNPDPSVQTTPTFDHGDRKYSSATDIRVGHHLAALDADVVVGTRPALNMHIAAHIAPAALRIAWSHRWFGSYREPVRLAMKHYYSQLDAIVSPSPMDAGTFERELGRGAVVIPNPMPAPSTTPSACSAPCVVAVGRLDPIKRFDDLIGAFAKVAERRPEWRLRIYGDGRERPRLEQLIDSLKLHENVTLMGRVTPIEPQMAAASILVVSSGLELFPNVIQEAMRSGLPIVSTDLPQGPREMIDHGVDGLLVQPGDSAAMADGLLELIDDAPRRQRMGQAALRKCSAFEPGAVAARWLSLFEELQVARARIA